MGGRRKTDQDTRRGIERSLRRALNGPFNGSGGLPLAHVAADAAAAEFAALLDELNDPPPQYRKEARCRS